MNSYNNTFWMELKNITTFKKKRGASHIMANLRFHEMDWAPSSPFASALEVDGYSPVTVSTPCKRKLPAPRKSHDQLETEKEEPLLPLTLPLTPLQPEDTVTQEWVRGEIEKAMQKMREWIRDEIQDPSGRSPPRSRLPPPSNIPGPSGIPQPSGIPKRSSSIGKRSPTLPGKTTDIKKSPTPVRKAQSGSPREQPAQRPPAVSAKQPRIKLSSQASNLIHVWRATTHITCPVEGCKEIYQSASGFRTHLSSKHPEVGEYDMVLPGYYAIRAKREHKKREEKVAKKA